MSLKMIDLGDLRNNPEAYQRACDVKGIKFDVQAFLELDQRYRKSKAEVEQLRARQNAVNDEIKTLSGDEKQARITEMKELAPKIKELTESVRELEQEWKAGQLRIPSIPLEHVPVGKDDTENVEVSRWGEIPSFDFELRDHVALGELLGIIDIKRGVKIAGTRNYFLVGDGARLQHAVLGLARDLLHQKGYLLMDCPHLVNYEAMMGTGYYPGGEEQAYCLDQRDDKHLIGTSEVAVCAYHLDEILDPAELPKRYAGYSACYRREAGTYGKDAHGLYRIHQFYKVEQVIIAQADKAKSDEYHRELLGNAEELMQALGLPYRVVDVCTGDLGQGQVYKNDIEAWMPSRESYGETHSCSSFYDFQARRLRMRYKDSDGKNRYCYTLNNTLIASPRILIPLLELNQNRDGTVNVPQALRPYMNGQELICP